MANDIANTQYKIMATTWFLTALGHFSVHFDDDEMVNFDLLKRMTYIYTCVCVYLMHTNNQNVWFSMHETSAQHVMAYLRFLELYQSRYEAYLNKIIQPQLIPCSWNPYAWNIVQSSTVSTMARFFVVAAIFHILINKQFVHT